MWLTPIYPSPQYDNGYDTSDYYNVNPLYGTIKDFKELTLNLKKYDMKLILDIAVNHTSTFHNWFVEACKSKDNAYRNYYIWKEGVNGSPPNNWQSKFGGSAW